MTCIIDMANRILDEAGDARGDDGMRFKSYSRCADVAREGDVWE